MSIQVANSNNVTPVTGEDYFIPVEIVKIRQALHNGQHRRIADVLSDTQQFTSTEKAILAHSLHLSRGSQGTNRVYLPNLVAFFNHAQVTIGNIRSWHIEDWLADIQRQGAKPATVSNKLAALKSLMGYLHKTGLLSLNPAATVKAPRHITSHHGDKVLMQEEIDTLLRTTRAQASARDYLLCAMLFQTGMRAAEVVGLCWGDIQQDVRGRWYATVVGKGNKSRTVHIPKAFMVDLMDFRAALYTVPPFAPALGLHPHPVFSQRTSGSKAITVSTVFRIVSGWGEKCLGKKISPHWLRHSFATHSRLAGATLEQIRAQLGHESYQTTLRYEHSHHLSEPAGAVLEEQHARCRQH